MMLKICLDILPDEEHRAWLEAKALEVSTGAKASKFYLAFSSAPRKTSKAPLTLRLAQLEQLRSLQPAFNPATWTIDELCRVTLMTCLPTETNHEVLEKLFGTADMRESVALYKGLSFLENAEAFRLRAIDGLRTNITPVFDAIALDNPYAEKYFAEQPWNQMVLKAMFMERPLYRIYGLDRRRNKTLALILRDYAHERWSAHRSVSTELWRNAVGFIDAPLLEDLQRVLNEGTGRERFAAALAIRESGLAEADTILDKAGIAPADLPEWDELGRAEEADKTLG